MPTRRNTSLVNRVRVQLARFGDQRPPSRRVAVAQPAVPAPVPVTSAAKVAKTST